MFLDRDQAVELLERAGRREYPLRDQVIDEETAKLLGLLKPSDSVSDVLKRVDQEQVLGFYDDGSKRLAVIRDAGVSRPLLELTLAQSCSMHSRISGSGWTCGRACAMTRRSRSRRSPRGPRPP
jgi:hypothetical protein